jgi:RecA/RadA recombinase
VSELDALLAGLGSRDLLLRMLTYAIRCPAVAELAVPKLEPADFNEATQFEFAYVWLAARSYWRDHSNAPPAHYVRDVAIYAMQQGGYTDTSFFQRAANLVEAIYSFNEEPWNVAYGKQLLSAFFDSVYIERLKQFATQIGDRKEIHERVLDEHRRLQVSDLPTLDPFDLIANPPDYINRMPTGVTPVDLLLNGGILPTECYGILGPSGGGKTLLALQIAGSLAKRQHRVVYFTYEQPAIELQPRLLSFVGGVHIDKLRNRRLADIAEADRKRIEVAAATCKGYVELLDRASAGDTITEIDLFVKRRTDEGKKPDMVVIDWIWPLILRMAAISPNKQRPERLSLQKAMDDIKAMAAERKTTVLVLHQLSTEVVKKAPANKPEWWNSAEAGSFAWLLHYCFAIGRADGNGFCWLVGSKSRNARHKDMLVKLNGAMNRFDPVDKSMQYDPTSKEFIEEVDIGKIPGVGTSTQDEPVEQTESDEPNELNTVDITDAEELSFMEIDNATQ